MGSAPSMDRVSCPICLEQFDNESHIPKILPCQHSFCEACIVQTTNQQTRSVKCSICRRPHVVPANGFMKNRAVIDIVDELENKRREIEKARCLMKCPNHQNKEVAYVCIDCLDTFCSTCAKSSIHIQAKHHVEEVDDAAPVLQQMLKDSQSSFEKLIEESPCSSTELAKSETDIESMANKIHAETTEWKTEQLSMVQEMKSFKDAHEKKKRELTPSDIDLNTLLQQMKQNQHQIIVDKEFIQKLHQRQAEDQNRFDKSLQTLLNKLKTEIESINAIQSKYLKKAASMTSSEEGYVQSVPREMKDEQPVKTPKQVADIKVPKSPKVLYKVRVINPNVAWFSSGVTAKRGDIIAVTEEQRGRRLKGMHERTGAQCSFRDWCVKKIRY